MSIRVQLALAEHFLNWYPYETKLYIRGERGKDRAVVDRLHKELFDQLCKFFDKHGLTTLRNDLLLANKRLAAWRQVWAAQRRYTDVCYSTQAPSPHIARARLRLDEAVELAEGLDR